LLYLAEPVTAERAEGLGLLTAVVDDLDAHVGRIARRLAATPPDALEAMRQHVARAGTEDLATCADAEAQRHVRLLDTQAHRDAVQSLTQRQR
jgi:enoyl-CoA hydratase/carnithine racemase